MDSFLVAFRVVVPMALLMLVGVGIRAAKIMDRDTMRKVDRMNSKIFIPALVFYNVYTTDFSVLKGSAFIFYGLGSLTVLFLFAAFLIPKLIGPGARAAALGQAVFRPNYVLYGAAVAQSIYGEGNIGIIMLMGAIAIPFFNSLCVVILEMGRSGKASPGKLLKAIASNPLVIGACSGVLLNLLGFQIPALAEGVVEDIAGIATPLSFISLGISMNVESVAKNRKVISAGVFTRLVLIPGVFLVGGILMGFRGPELCALMVLFASPTAVSSYPMAVSMDADGELAGQMVVFTTLFSLITIFLWVLLLNSLALL